MNLLNEVAYALDRNGLREQGWTEEAITRAMDLKDRPPSDFSLKEARACLDAFGDPAARIERLEGLLHRAWPMLNRLAHYERTVNQPSKALAEEIRVELFSPKRENSE